VTCNLRNNRGDFLVEREIAVLEQKAAHPSEVNRRKEVLQVEVENPSAVTVLAGVGDDRAFALETVRRPVLSLRGRVDFSDAVLQEVGQMAL
jgi:hypothetical protein